MTRFLSKDSIRVKRMSRFVVKPKTIESIEKLLYFLFAYINL